MELDQAKKFNDWKLWICEVTGEMDKEPDYVRYVEPHLYVVWNTVTATIHGKDSIEILDDVEYYDVRNISGEIEDFIENVDTIDELDQILDDIKLQKTILKLKVYMDFRADKENAEHSLQKEFYLSQYDNGVRTFFGVTIDIENIKIIDDVQNPKVFKDYLDNFEGTKGEQIAIENDSNPITSELLEDKELD
jgi:hypothetical protein|tara:strand:- start:3215 stop:3790 length:576 start_codon:yes stop_codon:yes gene_type:complete